MSCPAFDTDLAEWFKSVVGQRCSDVASLQAATSQNQFEAYVTQRLSAAYSAGWDAHAERIGVIISEHVATVAPLTKPQAG